MRDTLQEIKMGKRKKNCWKPPTPWAVKVLRVQFLKTTFPSPEHHLRCVQKWVALRLSDHNWTNIFCEHRNGAISDRRSPFKCRYAWFTLDWIRSRRLHRSIYSPSPIGVKSTGGPGQSQRAIANYASIQISGQLSLALGAVVWWWGPR